MSVLIYHGAGKKQMSSEDFSAYDVVITTYGLLSNTRRYQINELNHHQVPFRPSTSLEETPKPPLRYLVAAGEQT
jgi:hypothetical protein